MKDDKKDGVEVFHRVNRLKLKAGGSPDSQSGKLDPQMIAAANKVVADASSSYNKELERVMDKLNKAWLAIKNSGSASSAEIENLYHLSNQVKDLASTFNFKIMSDFAASLRKFVHVYDETNPNHKVIIQAHMDVMWVVYREDVKDGGGKMAQELKKTLSKAIEKHAKDAAE